MPAMPFNQANHTGVERRPAGSLRAAIFDFDGTLGDSVGVWQTVDRVFLEKRGLICDDTYIEAVRCRTFEAAAVYTIERYGLPETPTAVVNEWLSLAAEAYRCDVALKPGAKAYLAALKAHGIPMALATTSLPELCRPALCRNGIEEWFDVILTAAEVSRSKAHPDVFLAAADALGALPSETVVYEDLLLAVRTANRAGFRTVGVYDPSFTDEWPALRREATWSLETYCGAEWRSPFPELTSLRELAADDD